MVARTLVIGMLLTGLVGCKKEPVLGPESSALTAPTTKEMKFPTQTGGPLTREEMSDAVRTMKTPQEFIDRFGKPESTAQNGDSFMMVYKRITKDAITGKVDSSVYFHFTGQGMNSVFKTHSVS